MPLLRITNNPIFNKPFSILSYDINVFYNIECIKNVQVQTGNVYN